LTIIELKDRGELNEKNKKQTMVYIRRINTYRITFFVLLRIGWGIMATDYL
jgi:hypothetical protein